MPVPFLSGILKGYRRMKAIEIAQRLAQLNETESALQAYKLALAEEADPTVKMEAAVYILQFGKDDDYKISYTMFHDLYNQGIFKENILEIMEEAFYAPNMKLMKAHYKKNCALLEKYPYLFRKDFLKFEDLPIKFYPFDDTSYTPYYPAEERFGAYIDFKDTVIKHYFFKDLEKPILATDVTSQYELEYLRDNVRRSEDVAKENHIYLHYTSWAEFCSYLPCLNMKPLLEEQKMVFLFEDEIGQYPIDFKERFNIDYSKFTLQPVRIREVKKMIWHTQLSSHNGGDFFNEIFDSHPNLLAMPSVMMDNTHNNIAEIMEALRIAGSLAEAQRSLPSMEPELVQQLYTNRGRNEKDVLVALFLHQKSYYVHSLDTGSRIAPALFFQPHFYNIHYRLNVYESRNQTTLSSAVYDEVQKSPIFRNFKYIKTFTPMRRFTTSHGSTVKFMNIMAKFANENNTKGDDAVTVVTDAVMERVLNRSFMVDPDDRLYHDGVVVRLEDGKINPRATFAALAHFLDLPYTESMTYCSSEGKRDPNLGGDYATGFSLASVYRNVDEYMNGNEGRFIEYFLRDAYEYYGYDFLYYDGKPVDNEAVSSWVSGFDKMNQYIAETWKIIFRQAKVSANGMPVEADIEEKVQAEMLGNYMKDVEKHRIENAEVLLRGLNFINENGQPLRMMPKLEPDPALLEQPLYH